MRPASLQRFLVLWLCVGALACTALFALWQATRAYLVLAQEQDARLVAAASRLASAPQDILELTASPDSDDRQAWLRLDSTSGERLAGAASLPPYPWPRELQAGAAPALYYSHAGASIVRAAATLVRGHAGSEDTIVQVAEPFAHRWPGTATLATPAALAFYLGVAAIGALGIALALLGGRWTRRAARSLERAGDASATYEGPDELRPAFEQMRALHAAERQWVDEQRRFLADAAHQLRTPLAVLRTQLQALLQREGDVRASLDDMIHTVDRATGLANQLLSVSKLEQLKREGRLHDVPLAPAVRDAVVELSPLISRKRLEFSLEGEDVQVQGEAMMLGELLRNLLANAIHHSLPGARLGIVLRSGLPWSELVVWDEGESIDSAVKPRLFTPFSAGKGGVGLGLSICQQLAAAMGASVSLHNRMQDGRAVGVDAVVSWLPPQRAP
jgi:two-component system, OmpR family, sensor histidine kinase TctE